MKSEPDWKPSKFVAADGRWVANRDAQSVSISSRLCVDLLAAALQPAIAAHAGGRLLDLGCGSVPLYEMYRDHVDEIVCVDWFNTAHDSRHLDFEADLNEPLAIESATFDTVILTDVLEHIREPAQLLRETRRVLRAGGVLIGSVPFLYRLHEEPHDHYRYTIHTLRRMAAQSGFEVTLLEPYGYGTDVLFDVLGKLLLTVHWRIGPRLAAWTQALGHRCRRSRIGRHVNRNQQSMPIGYLFALRAADVPAGPASGEQAPQARDKRSGGR